MNYSASYTFVLNKYGHKTYGTLGWALLFSKLRGEKSELILHWINI